MIDNEVQEIKLKKRSLKRYRNNLACIDRLEKKIILLDERLTSLRSTNFSGMPRGGTPVTIDDLLSDKVDLENRVKRLKEKNKPIKAKILEEIDSLEDFRYCEVLEAYFIECKSIADIAEEMCYTDRYVYDLYKEAVRELAINNTSVTLQ